MIFALLKLLARLPLSILYIVSDLAYLVVYYLVRYRRPVVRVNLTSAFPDKNLREIKKIEKKYYRYLGDQIVETLKLLHISDAELQKRVKVTNAEAVNNCLSRGSNAVLLMGHYNNWEWVQEITRYFIPTAFMVSIYHPLNHEPWDKIFIQLRSRWNAHIVPMKTAPRVLLSKANMPWVCGFIADGFTHLKHDNNWIEFLNHKTWFIYGPEEIGAKTKADFFYLEMKRIKRGNYEILFHTLKPKDTSLPFPYTRQFWLEFEKTIEENPPYWLWSHKRWK